MRNKAPKVVDKSEVLKKVLTADAIEKLKSFKISHPVIASQLEAYLIHAHRSGQIDGKINDVKLRQVFDVLTLKREPIKKRK